jgi:hypothetical protein
MALTPLLLDLIDTRKVGLLRSLNVRLTLAFLVLKGTAKKHIARLMYAPTHLRVHDILVKHDARQDAAVLDPRGHSA